MSLDVIKKTFEELVNIHELSIQLLNIHSSKNTGTGYSSRQISLDFEDSAKILSDIVDLYIGQKKNKISQYKEVRAYDGTADTMVVYKLPSDSELICSEYTSFITEIANPNQENDPFVYKSAYLIKGIIQVNMEDINIKLISMQSPVTKLKHKFSLESNGKFQLISDKILYLRPTMDILILNDKVYFLTLAGENLFNMARSYRAVCQEKISTIESSDIIGDIDTFKAIASSGHNPRRFVSFNDARLNALKNTMKRKSMAKKFSIPLDSDLKFDTTVEGTAEKIVKLLCNKGMIDPFDQVPVEVDGARKWL